MSAPYFSDSTQFIDLNTILIYFYGVIAICFFKLTSCTNSDLSEYLVFSFPAQKRNGLHMHYFQPPPPPQNCLASILSWYITSLAIHSLLGKRPQRRMYSFCSLSRETFSPVSTPNYQCITLKIPSVMASETVPYSQNK